MALIPLAVGAVGGIMGNQEKQAQYGEDVKARSLAIGSINDARKAEIRDAQDAFDQASQSAAYEASDDRIAGDKAQATASVSAGEAGISGNTVTDIMNNYEGSKERNLQAVKMRIEFERDERARSGRTTERNVKNRLLNLGPLPKEPNLLMDMFSGTMGGAGSAASIYTAGT
jgi:hypothetical protein